MMRMESDARTVYGKVKRRYADYLKLYRTLGDGTTNGATPFDQFYWRFIYYTIYSDLSKFSRSGY